jgi:2-polyprenyl-6-methoxyphenol hydroxylase-like FAD-dependent oxidoreductase
VDASGRNAVAARKLGAKRRRYDGLIGLQGRVEGCEPTDEAGRVHIESVRDGWWYGVVFSDGTLLATLMTDASLAREFDGSVADLWESRLDESRMLATLAGTGRWSGSVQTFDAATQVIDFDAPADLLAVGDAAAAWDPLSSWGITKGLCDGHAGARALARERDGEAGSVERHRATQQQDFESYRSRQLDFYRAETRWSALPFWRARQHDSRRSDHREGK